MISASASRTIDFSKADCYDQRWTTLLSWMIEEVERNKTVQTLSNLRDHLLVGCRITTPEQADKDWKMAFQVMNNMSELILPWTYKPQDGGKRLESTAESMKSIWESKWGKMTDPDVKKKIADTVKFLEAGDIKTRKRRKK